MTKAGDVVYFTVQRKTIGEAAESLVNEVAACGMGQWGAIGNGLFSSAQGTPTKVKVISGILECPFLSCRNFDLHWHVVADDDRTQQSQPVNIDRLSAAYYGHAIVTLDTALRAGSIGEQTKDLLTWELVDYLLRMFSIDDNTRAKLNKDVSSTIEKVQGKKPT